MASITDTSAAISTGQVAVTSSAAVQIRPTNANRSKLTLSSSVPIYIADSSGGAATGYPPFGTNNGGINYDIPTQDAVWAIGVGPNGTVLFMEFHTP
jgi:hypothetical protein